MTSLPTRFAADHPLVIAQLRREAERREDMRARRPELFVDLDLVEVVDHPTSDVARWLRGHVVPGSVLVAHHQSEIDTCRVDYEGGVFSRTGRAPTPQERVDYAKIAAGRAAENYPTVARIGCVPRADLRTIGRCNPGEGLVEFFA